MQADASEYKIDNRKAREGSNRTTEPSPCLVSTSEHEWTLPSDTRQMVIDKMPSDTKLKGVKSYYLISGLKGYSPADAVQDFKKAPKYVLKYGGATHVGTNSGKIK